MKDNTAPVPSDAAKACAEIAMRMVDTMAARHNLKQTPNGPPRNEVTEGVAKVFAEIMADPSKAQDYIDALDAGIAIASVGLTPDFGGDKPPSAPRFP